MTTTLPWALGAALVSMALACILVFLLHREKTRHGRKRPALYTIWVGMSVLVVLLSACGDPSSTNGDAAPTKTPVVLTHTPQSTATAHAPTASSTDWTT